MRYSNRRVFNIQMKQHAGNKPHTTTKNNRSAARSYKRKHNFISRQHTNTQLKIEVLKKKLLADIIKKLHVLYKNCTDFIIPHYDFDLHVFDKHYCYEWSTGHNNYKLEKTAACKWKLWTIDKDPILFDISESTQQHYNYELQPELNQRTLFNRTYRNYTLLTSNFELKVCLNQLVDLNCYNLMEMPLESIEDLIS